MAQSVGSCSAPSVRFLVVRRSASCQNVFRRHGRRVPGQYGQKVQENDALSAWTPRRHGRKVLNGTAHGSCWVVRLESAGWYCLQYVVPGRSDRKALDGTSFVSSWAVLSGSVGLYCQCGPGGGVGTYWLVLSV
jgi:hypothetical protein